MPAGGEEDALACNRPAARAAPPQRPAPLPPDRRPVPMRPARPPPQPPQAPELPQAPVLGWQDARSIELQFPESPPANEDDISDEENAQLEALRAEMAALDEEGGEGAADGQEEQEQEDPVDGDAEEGDDERAQIVALEAEVAELEQAVDDEAGDSEAEDDDTAIAALQSEVAVLERGLSSDSDDSDEGDIAALEAGARCVSSLCGLCNILLSAPAMRAEVAALEADVAADERPSRTPPRLVSRTPPRPRSGPATLARKLPEPEPEPEPLSSFRPRRRVIQRESEPADEAEAPTLTMGFAPASDSVGVPPGYSRVLARPSLSALQRVDMAGARRARELAADIDSLVRTCT